MMEWTGLALLILVGVGIISTGLPAAFILIAVASIGALVGLSTGTIPLSLLGALPGRLINFVRKRPATSFAALRDHGLAARPLAGGRRALSQQQCDFAEGWLCGIGHAARRLARADERLGRRQRAR